MQATNRPISMELGLNTRAEYIFFSLYVSKFSTILETIVPLYQQASSFDHLSASVEAVSLSFLANQSHDPSVMFLSRSSYLVAIRRVRGALTALSASDVSPTSNVESLLLSIILLDMYEKVTSRNPQALSSWMSHAVGGLSLLLSHSSQLISSPMGCRLSARLISAITVSCGTTAVSVPESVVQLRGLLDPFLSDIKWRFTGILRHVVNLQVDIRHHVIGDSTIDLAERAWYLDKLLQNLYTTLPPFWKSRKTFLLSPLILGSHYNVHESHYITQVTNGIHVMRLMVNNIILKHILGETSSNNVLCRTQDIIQEICDSVPQYILSTGRWENSVPFTPLQSLQCYTLLAPLHIAYQQSAQSNVRDWIIQALRYMSETGGMKAAQEVMEIIGNTPDLDYWMVYATIGGYALAA
jgi:hypothetical protein